MTVDGHTDGDEPRCVPENILVDGHVHVHPCFDLPTLLESVQRNFGDAASTLGLGSEFRAVLLLTESQGTNYLLRRTTLWDDPAVAMELAPQLITLFDWDKRPADIELRRLGDTLESAS